MYFVYDLIIIIIIIIIIAVLVLHSYEKVSLAEFG